MLTYFFYLLAVFLSLTFVGIWFTSHLSNSEEKEFYAPWIGVAVIGIISFLINVSLKALNAAYVLIALFVISFVLWKLAKKFDFGFKEKHIWIYMFYLAVMYVFMSFFYNRFGDPILAERGKNLLTNSVLSNPNQMEAGISLVIVTFSELLNISPLTISRLMHSIFSVLSISLVSQLLIKISRQKFKDYYFVISLVLTAGAFFLFQKVQISLEEVTIAGILGLLTHVTLDYFKVLESSEKKLFTIEEIILTIIFLFLSILTIDALKIGIILFLFLISIRLLIQKHQLSYRWLRILMVIIIFNPLLIGSLLRI